MPKAKLLKSDVPFDEALRRVMLIPPAPQPQKPVKRKAVKAKKAKP